MELVQLLSLPRIKLTTLSIGICALLLTACQNKTPSTPGGSTSPLSTDERFHLGLGSAQQTNPLSAEETLKKVLVEHQANDNALGVARANWALGELLKSSNYQNQVTPPQNMAAYMAAADYFKAAALAYQKLGKTALAASAYIGQANAFLLANKLGDSCTAFTQAQTLSQSTPSSNEALERDNLNRNLRFFKDLTTVCAANPK